METELQSYAPKTQEVDFAGSDTENLFRKNLKTYKTWIYADKPITYRYNEHGFRNKSFNEVDWSKSIVVIGCSHVEGIGLALEDTICWHLEKIMNIPVVNLGVGGSAVDFACWNSLRLHNYYPRPKALVHVWTSLARYTDRWKNIYFSFLPKYREYNNKLNWTYRSKYYIETDRALWKDKVPYIEATFFDKDYLQNDMIKLYHLDQARDLMHPGIKSSHIAAKKIAEQLRKQGV